MPSPAEDHIAAAWLQAAATAMVVALTAARNIASRDVPTPWGPARNPRDPTTRQTARGDDLEPEGPDRGPDTLHRQGPYHPHGPSQSAQPDIRQSPDVQYAAIANYGSSPKAADQRHTQPAAPGRRPPSTRRGQSSPRPADESRGYALDDATSSTARSEAIRASGFGQVGGKVGDRPASSRPRKGRARQTLSRAPGATPRRQGPGPGTCPRNGQQSRPAVHGRWLRDQAPLQWRVANSAYAGCPPGTSLDGR